ncbi:MAG: fibrobacter succinogenes major paralogous domain-containing protein [Bacteroidales bacterium]|nr:fibrobacter succinogenes major paralogous domain-containing protein [Bacteroidales bacterium]
MKKITTILFTLLLSTASLMAQVAINDDNSDPNASAILDLKSSNKGFLPPRMSQAEMNAIVSPTIGLVVYCTDCSPAGLYVNQTEGVAGFVSASAAANNPVATSGAYGSTFSIDNGDPLYEPFSDNTTCADKLISAGYTSLTCNGTVVTGNAVYDVVLINRQCWMKQNLKTMPSAYGSNTGTYWLNTNPGDISSWGYYNTTTTDGTAGWAMTEPAAGEGLLYQWSAAMNGNTSERAQGVCPSGWHIPSDCEWMYLEHGLGMSIADQQATGDRNSGSVGSQLSNLTSGGTNSSGFTALLPGYRVGSGIFGNYNIKTNFWTSSLNSSTTAYYRELHSADLGVYRLYAPNYSGNSVRCLKD